MTEEQIKTEMDKSIREVFNTDEIINFQFDLVQKALLKGLDLGMKIGKESKLGYDIHYPKKNPDDLPDGEVWVIFDQNPNSKTRVYGTSLAYYNHFEKEWHGYYQGTPCILHNILVWIELPKYYDIPDYLNL